MMMDVPFFTLSPLYESLRTELECAFARVLNNGQAILGPELGAFEREFAESHSAKFAVGTGNGLDALVLGLRALGMGPGDQVLVPAFTFIATWLAVSLVGATPVPVDVDPVTRTLDPDALRANLSDSVKAVIPVHLYGHPADMDAIRAVVKERRIAIIEDCAQAHGAKYKGEAVGTLGEMSAFSFYPTKNLGCIGDGGIVLTNQSELAERVARLRNYGSARKYVHDDKGVNSRLDELQAAILRVFLPRLGERNRKRRMLAERYLVGLAGAPIVLPETRAWAQHVWHLFVVSVPGGHRASSDRDRLIEHLQAKGISTLVHYPSLPYQTGAYSEMCNLEGRCPVSERLAREVVSLPLWPEMQFSDVDRVVDAVHTFFGSK